MTNKLKLVLFIPLVIVCSVAIAGAKKVSPTKVSGATTVDAVAAKKLFDKGVKFIDVRRNSDWKAGHIKGAKHLELKKIYSATTLRKQIDKGQAVVIYCNGPKCLRSSEASTKAVAWGFKKVYYFRNGLPEWKAKGFPTEK